MNEQEPSLSKSANYKVTSAQLDRLVDTRNMSYDEAYIFLGVTPEEVDFSEDRNASDTVHKLSDIEEGFFTEKSVQEGPKTALETLRSIEPGPSLSLLARAKALDAIMKQFNQESKAVGAHLSRDYNGMQDRYGASTERVLSNMSAIATRMGSEALQAIFTLARGDSGVPMPDGIDYSGSIESNLRSNYGPRRADARQRSKLITRVYRTAGTTKTKHR